MLVARAVPVEGPEVWGIKGKVSTKAAGAGSKGRHAAILGVKALNSTCHQIPAAMHDIMGAT